MKFVIEPNRYTKHYYAGTERVCARIGGGSLNHNLDFIGDNLEMTGNAEDLFDECNTGMMHRTLHDNNPEDISSPCHAPSELFSELKSTTTNVNAVNSIALGGFEAAMTDNAMVDLDPEDGYFYHSDHLGSASWISDNTGAPVQHLQYLPFGDPFVDQHASNYNERFTFTGKELDQETGFSYFGARYLDHTLTTAWLSVDPMADKYPSISPYAYCAWNPVKLVDPEGENIDDYFSKAGKYLGTDNAETNNVRIIDEVFWNQHSNGLGQIDQEIGKSNSSILSESKISESALLSIYRFYWKKINSNYSNVNICAEKRPGKIGVHYMEAKTNCRTYINSVAKYTRTIYVDMDIMNRKKYSDNAYDIISCFEHEDRHLFQQSNANQVFLGEEEYDALKTQVNSSTFEKCSPNYQKEIRNQLKEKTPLYIKRICPDLY